MEKENISDIRIYSIILDIVTNDHSGGIKFMDLLVILQEKFPNFILHPEQIETIIRENGKEELKILEYTHNSLRLKMFIYTP